MSDTGGAGLTSGIEMSRTLWGRIGADALTRWSTDEPWFRAHPRLAAAVTAITTAGVLLFQSLGARPSDGVDLLYVLPIGLAAVTFGIWGGLGAAAGAYLAFATFATFSGADHVEIDGWVTRAVAMFLLGGLLGLASDQTARAMELALTHQRKRMVVEEQNRRYGEAMEFSDSILQHVAAAKWAVERGDLDTATHLLTLAVSSGQDLLKELLPPRSATTPLTDGPQGPPAGDPG